MAMKCLPLGCSKITMHSNGIRVSYKGGSWHSFNDQPAVFYLNGDMWYCKEGQCHRSYNKPALIYSSGDKFYFKEGKEYYLESELE